MTAEDDRKRITISVDAETNARLEATAAEEGVSVSELCREIVEVELHYAKFGDRRRRGGPLTQESLDILDEARKRLMGGRKFPGNSADVIREMREERALQIERAVEGR